MTSLSQFARALGGEVVGHQILAPGPGHSAKDRSLSVRLSASAPDGFVVHSHAGDDVMMCRDHVRARLGWQAFGPQRNRPTIERSLRAVPDTPDGDELAKIARARRIFVEAKDPRGTVVENYLTSRGLTLPFEVVGTTIRFHPACPWRDEESGRTIFVPAMVAAMRSIRTEKVTAVHRTRLTPDGRKVDRRMLGKASGAAIMLCPWSALDGGVTIGEGIETCLAAWQLGWSNAWALGSVGALAAFPLITGISAITILAETDDQGASARAVDAVGNQYATAGREVFLVTPNIPGDMNDVVLRGAA